MKLGAKKLYIKIFGERNTGTNYLHQLCVQNFSALMLRGDIGTLWGLGQTLAAAQAPEQQGTLRQRLHDLEIERILHSDFGWKHAAPDLGAIDASATSRHTLFIVLTKHPVSWLKSLHRNPYSFTAPAAAFSDFIRSDMPVNFSDGLPGVTSCTPPALLRRKVLAYRTLLDSQHTVVHLRYEDLIENFEESMLLLAESLFRKTKAFVNYENDVKGTGRGLQDFVQAYALQNAAGGISAEDADFIRTQVGPDIFDYLGYDY